MNNKRLLMFRPWILCFLVVIALFSCWQLTFAEDNSKSTPIWIDRTTVSGMNILLQKTDSKVIDIVLLLKSGSGLEPSNKKGTALIMNNIVYTRLRYSKIKIGQIDVETYPDYTVISLKTTNSGIKKALEMIKSLLSERMYTYDGITDLKGIYSNGLKGISPFYRAYSDFASQFYGEGHPYNDRLDSDRILMINGKDVYQWYRQTYQPGNAILSITGKVSQSIKNLEKFFGDMYTESVDRRLMVAPVTLEKDLKIDHEEINGRVSTVSIGYAAPRFSDPDYPAFRVIAYYLNDYMHYFDELRVKEGLFYAGFVIYDYFEKPKSPSMVFLTMTTPDSLARVETKTLEVVSKLINEGISQPEIDKVIQSMKANNTSLLEVEKNYALKNALSQYLQTQMVYDDNLLAKLTAIKTEDIKRSAAKYLQHYIRVAYTPKEMVENF